MTTKNDNSGGIADEDNVYDIEDDRQSIDSLYNTDNDEAMCLAAAKIAEEFEREKEEEEKRKTEEGRAAKMEMIMATPSSSSSSIVPMPSQSAIFSHDDNRSKEEMAKEITDLKAQINHWKGKAIYLEFEETRLEKENKKMHTEMANAKNESFELRQRIEKEQNERDKEMERIRTAMPFQEQPEQEQLLKTNRKRRHPQQQNATEQIGEDYENDQQSASNQDIDCVDADGKFSTTKSTTDFFRAHFCDEQLEDELLLKKLENGRPGANYAVREKLTLPNELEQQYAATLTSWGHSTSKIEPESPLTLDAGISFKRLLRLYHQLPELKSMTSSKTPEMHKALYNYMGRYMDICCASREQQEITPLICLHLLNHVMRTRNLVIANKQRLQKAKEQNHLNDELIEQCRDQGLSRPKILLLCPFRKFAHFLVCTMRSLMFVPGEKPFMQNWQRFEEEFGDAEGNRVSEKRQVTKEFRELMSGNMDDCFKIGIGLAKKCLKLYTPFDQSDIILCSPLGLKMLIGDEGGGDEEEEAEREEKKKTNKNADGTGGTHDFLASIEMLIIQNAEVLLMQNWEHLMTVLAATNRIPDKIRVDITRVRQWSVRPGVAKHFCQTILFSSLNFAEMHALFAKYCANYAGLVTLVQSPVEPLPIKQISSSNVQEFHWFNASSPEEQAERRFKYFVKELLPKCEPGTLVFVPSYFDFVRLRNYLKRQMQSFVQLHEYAEAGRVAKARQLFVLGDRRLMLLTERFHFFFRYRIKGVRSLLFYQAPVNPEFYPELVDMPASLGQLPTTESERLPCRLLYCLYDVLRLQNIFGTEATHRLLRPASAAADEPTVQTLVAN